MSAQSDPAALAPPLPETAPSVPVPALPDMPRTTPLRAACANCATPLIGRYCHNCSQSSAPTSMRLRDLVSDYIYMMLKIDSKLLHALRVLLLSPGKLSVDYRNGIVVPYPRPLRLIFIMSFAVFVIFALADLKFMQSKIEFAPDAHVTRGADGMPQRRGVKENFVGISRTLPKPNPPAEFMASLERELARKNNWQADKLLRVWRATATDDPVKDLWTKGLPLIYVAISPLFAGLLALFYRGKRYMFVDHLVFAVHVHSLGLLLLLLPALFAYVWPAGLDLYLESMLFIGYIVLAARTFYGSSWLASVLKGVMLGLLDLGLIMVAGVSLVFGILLMT